MSAQGEKYKSASAMRKHEKTEGAKERKREYGNGPSRKAVKAGPAMSGKHCKTCKC